MIVFCPNCKTKEELSTQKWRCDCGEAWEPYFSEKFDKRRINQYRYDIWRYLDLFELGHIKPIISRGVGWTPLLETKFNNFQIHVKLEYISPTGSFKDRGTEVEINLLKHQNVRTVVDDPSGNAGASLAAYAARGEMQSRIFVPHYASKAKQNQISIYNANVIPVPGTREDVKKEAQKTIAGGTIYASHTYHPGFLLGQETIAWEIWEQLNERAPNWLIVPVGQGVQLIGAWLGFNRLKSAGLITKVPRLVAVQPTLLDPIVRSINSGTNEFIEVDVKQPSIAEGLAIRKPVRWNRIVQAVKDSNGIGISVTEKEIAKGIYELGKKGFFVEPTSATVFAALTKMSNLINTSELIVLSLTGTGLKGIPSRI